MTAEGVLVGLLLIAAWAVMTSSTAQATVFWSWLGGMLIGTQCLLLGFEVMAWTQWILSTFLAVAMIFFSASFGDPLRSYRWSRYVVWPLFPVLLVLLFFRITNFIGEPDGSLKDTLGLDLVTRYTVPLGIVVLAALTFGLVAGAVIRRSGTEEAD